MIRKASPKACLGRHRRLNTGLSDKIMRDSRSLESEETQAKTHLIVRHFMPRDRDKNNAPPRGTRGAGRHAGKGRDGGGERSRDERPARSGGKSFGAKKSFGEKKSFGAKSFGDRKPGAKLGAKRPYADRPASDRPRPDRPFAAKSDRVRDDGDRPRPRFNRDDRPPRSRDDRPDRGPRKDFRPREDRGGEDRPRFKPREDRGGERPFTPRNRDDHAPRGERGDARPPRSRDDRPNRGPRKDFRPREDRGGEDRPRFKPREDRGGERPFTPRNRDDRAPRGERSDARPAGRFADKKFGDKRPYGEKRPFAGKGEGFRKDGDRPRSGGFRRDEGERPFSARGPRKPREDFEGRDRSAEKPWQRRDAAARDDGRRGGPRDERPPREERRFDRPRDERPRRDGDERPRFSRSRDDRAGGDRPRFDRSKSDRPKFDRPRDSDAAWQDHPRSERGEQDDSKIFAKRPAFGGRGAYRERKPESDRRSKRPAVAPEAKKPGERIAKRLARAGLCSRRDAEEWIMQGRVTVNGRVLTSPALDVTERDVVMVDGKPLPERERTRLFLYHKPRGLMTTHDDPEGRPTVFDNLPDHLPRLISIGRLDFNTEGLLLLTNDGGLARALELPDTGWLRRYRVRAHGTITQGQLDELRKGVEVDGVKYGSIDAQLEHDQGANVWLVFAIREGKNREVRNVMAHLGLEVNRLIRVSYGPFQLAELGEGEVEEIRTRVLREQLGDKIVALSGAEFGARVTSDAPGDDETGGTHRDKPVKRSRGVVADRKGRTVVVERSGERDEGGERPYRRPKRAYHGKRDIKPRED
jgi:23S rRNA pseudouridine2605 synthase